MPYKSKHRCGYPGCPALVDAGTRFCSDHNTAATNPAVRKADTSHYDRRWQKIRAMYLAKNPLCAECQKAGRLTPANEVHHIVAVNDGGSDHDDNLMGLCKSCHSRKTAKEYAFGRW